MSYIQERSVFQPYVLDGVVYDKDRYPKEVIEGVRTLEFDPTDVLIVGYPKTGTTWCEEMLWLIRHKVDTEAAAQTPSSIRMPFLEKGPTSDLASGLDRLLAQPHPRIVYSNLHYQYFSKAIEKSGIKVIVTLRNPKDTMVSQFHFINNIFQPVYPTFSDFLEAVHKKQVPHGDWCDFVLSWWSNHTKDNFLFIKYEDIKADHAGTVRKMAEFLGENLTEEQVQEVARFTSFDEMKKRPKEGAGSQFNPGVFTRKGVVGDWKNHFTKEQAQLIDQYVASRLKGTGLTFNENEPIINVV